MLSSLRFYLQSTTLGLAFLVGAGLTIWGFVQMYQLKSYHPSWGNLPLTIASLVMVALAVEVFSRRMKINRLAVGGVIAGAVTILTGTVWPLMVTIWLASSSYVVGISILSLLKSDKDRVTGINALLIGAGVYATGVGLIAHYPVNYPGLYGVALAIPVIFGWRSIYAGVQSLSKFLVPSPEFRFLDLAIVIFALLHFSVSLMPEVGHDALMMHLFVPGHLALNHVWSFDVNTYAWAVMPMLGDWLFSIGYMLGGETAARFINVGFIFILCWLIRNLVIWAGADALSARWAVLLFLTTPLTFLESSSLYIESIWATFIVAGSLLVFRLLESNHHEQKHLLPVAGIFLGLGLAAKAVAFTILPVFFLLLVFRWRKWTKLILLRPVTLGLFLFFAFGSIPYITAWYLTGNPVFPFFNGIFQSPLWPAMNFDAFGVFAEGLKWDVLYQATFHTEKFLESKPGAVGFQWLLLFAPAFLMLIISKPRKGIILFVVAGLSVAFTFYASAYLRYVFPSFVWAAAGIGVAFSIKYAESVLFRRFLSIIGCVVIFLNFVFLKSGTWYGQVSMQPLMSQQGRETYLNKRLPIRNAIELVNKLNVGRTPVAVFSFPLVAGLRADALYPLWYNNDFQEKFGKTKTSQDIADLLLEYGVDFIILESNWYQTEKRVMIEELSTKLADIGNISVRRINDVYRFQTELMKNPDFSSFGGWTFSSGNADQHPGQITSSVSKPAYQVLPVKPGHHYLNSVTAICSQQPTQGRVQVNWLDSDSDFMTTSLLVFDCITTESTHSMEVTAPSRASEAVVYAIGHTEIPKMIKEVSFRL